MELFRYRNLALGSCAFLVSLFISFYVNNTVRIATLALAGAAFIFLILLTLIKRSKGTLNALCHLTPTFLFIVFAMILALIFFDKSKLEKHCDGKTHEIVATVEDVIYQTSYMGYYEVELSSIDGNDFSDKIKITLNAEPINRGDIINSKGIFYALNSSSLAFDEAGYLLSHGVTVGFVSDNFCLVGHKETPLFDFFESINEALDNQFAKINNESTHAMLSALFLGNKSQLNPSVQRDFSRIGLSHVLALSGMHITIIVTIFGYALYLFPIRRIYKELLLIIATFLFVGITGFSDSALRAGLMVCLVYTLFFFGNRTSLTSSLFYSVTILCIVNPYSIFSLSLMLSFFAMLGCIFSSKIIHRGRLFLKIRFKPVRFAVFTFISSVFACLFTLPLISVQFGTLAVLSPITNILVSPLLSLLIYFAPVFLIVADIPYISVGFGWVCTKTAELSTYLAQTFSSIDNIVFPIKSTFQFTGIILLSVFLLLLLLCKRKYLRYMSVGSVCGFLVFLGGTIALFCVRNSNVYAGIYSIEGDDVAFVENEGALTIIDITNTSGGDYALSNSVSLTLGYYEIENYIITDYSSKTHICFNNLSSHTIVKNVYLPFPVDEEEASTLNSIKEIALSKNIDVHLLENELLFNGVKITFSKEQFLPRSKKRAVAFSLECSQVRFTYLGAGAFEVCDYFATDTAYLSDIVVFGSYGPKRKVEFSYSLPYLDHCVFLGDSQEYAADDFYKKVKDKISTSPRFLLTP